MRPPVTRGVVTGSSSAELAVARRSGFVARLGAGIWRRCKGLLGVSLPRKPEFGVAHQHFGSQYGGWAICPELIGPKSIVYSVGVGTDATFDLEIIERFGVLVHAFDPTPASAHWVERQHLPGAFRFHRVGLAAFDGEATFHPPEDPSHVSHSIVARRHLGGPSLPVRRLSSIMRELGHTHLDLLKLDIEGAEYEVVDNLLAEGIPIAQLLVEFHHFLPGIGERSTRKALRKLSRNGFRLFWVSPGATEYGFVGPSASTVLLPYAQAERAKSP